MVTGAGAVLPTVMSALDVMGPAWKSCVKWD